MIESPFLEACDVFEALAESLTRWLRWNKFLVDVAMPGFQAALGDYDVETRMYWETRCLCGGDELTQRTAS
jgi:hypothetical protein